MDINPVVNIAYEDGRCSITFVPLRLGVGSHAYLVVRLIASIRNDPIPIGYIIFRGVLLVRELEPGHRKR